MKYIIFFLFLSQTAFSQIVFTQDSIVDYGGEAAYKRAVISIEVIKDTSIISARRLEIERQLTALNFELDLLNDLQLQYEAIMGGMSIMKSGAKTKKKQPARKPKRKKQ